MLLVRASLKPSPIHGLGCFTEERITPGQLVWVFDPRVDIRLPAVELPNLPPPIQAFYRMYAYEELHQGQRVFVLCGDYARHMNHSTSPNLVEGPQGENYAARDIQPGEELTCNYHDFDLDIGSKLP